MSIDKESSHIYIDDGSKDGADQATQRVRLNKEDLRILQECNKESFYYRSLPLAAVAMATTYVAVKRGLLQPHPRWGPGFKLAGAGFVGWFVGKISYRSKCEEKFLHVHNSTLGDMIRKKRGYTSETFKDRPSSYTGEVMSVDNAPTYSADVDFTSSSRSLNLDTDKNIQYAGLDDSHRTKSEFDTQPEDRPQKYSTTYEDLRRKNREEHENRQSKLYLPPSTTSPSSSKDWSSLGNKPPPRESAFKRDVPGKENVYGDQWDK